MRLLLDANVLLDCLVLENSGASRAGKTASDQIFELCDQGIHQGLVAWHTLPIIAYYHGRQNKVVDTAAMMESLLQVLYVPGVSHQDAVSWKQTGLIDFEDALQVVCARSGLADVIITRNISDFASSPFPSMTPEQFLAAQP